MSPAAEQQRTDAGANAQLNPATVSIGVPSSRAADLVRRIGAVEGTLPELHSIDALTSSSRCIWLIDHPVWALLSADGVVESHPSTALDHWCLAARGLMQRVHTQPGRDVVVVVEEVAESPAEFQVAAAQRIGIVLAPFEAPQFITPDPSLLWVATAFCAAHPRASALYEELRALSVPLMPTRGEMPGPASNPLNDAGAAAEALLRLRKLLESESASATRAAEFMAVNERLVLLQREVDDLREAAHGARQVAEAAESRLQDAQAAVQAERSARDLAHRASIDDRREAESARAALQALRTSNAEAAAEFAAAETALNAVRQEAEVWRLQAAVSGDELRSVQHSQRSERRRLEQNVAEQARQLSELRKECRQHRAALDTATTELRKERRRHQAALDAVTQQSRRQEEASAAASLQLRHRITSLESELGDVVQQASHSSHAAFRAHAEGLTLEGDDLGAAVRGLPAAQIVAVRDEPPHRELRLSAERSHPAGLDRGPLQIKLVEHEGRAGLAVMSTAGSVAPIAQWQPTGVEGQTPYMLFVPGDAAGRQSLALLGTSDWGHVLHLAAWAELSVARLSQDLAPRWQAVAARLRVELLSLPPRLRYDALTATGDDRGLVVEFRNAAFGGRLLGDVRVRWKPADPMSPMELLHHGDTPPLIPGWPLLDDGTLADAWPLPWGARQPLGARLRWWHARRGLERDLMLSLVDGLRAAPALVQQDGAGTPHPCTLAAALRLKDRSVTDCRWARLATFFRQRGR